jgi:hypothetical protein
MGISVAIPVSIWSIPWAAAFFLSSMAIDLDHFLSYWFKEKAVSLNLRQFLSNYLKWDYYGPRVQIFHNYEFLVLVGAGAFQYKGIFLWVFAGVFLHLICDQAESYYRFRYMRVKTFVGDILRYKEYLNAKRQGREKEYMVKRRDSWRNHLRTSLSKEQFKKTENQCGIWEIYPEMPIDKLCDGEAWKRLL